MGEAYWNDQSGGSLKRHRVEFDVHPSGAPNAPETPSYLDKNGDLGGPRTFMDTKSLELAYDEYLRNLRSPSYEGVQYGQEGFERAVGVDLPTFRLHEPTTTRHPEPYGSELSPNGSGLCFGGTLPVDRVTGPQEILPLPPDASSTLYIEGLPSDCTKREVAHIFRPFVGYKEVRIVRKEGKYRDGDPVIISFVDFEDEACSATALSALQGYKMDEHDPHSPKLRLQFSKFPGPRSSSGSTPHTRR